MPRQSKFGILVFLLAGVVASTSSRGTPGEAKAMLLKAVAHYKLVGRKQALADFSASKAPFRDRDLYVFCIGPDHVVSANGGFPEIVGVQEDSVAVVDGKGLGSVARRATATKGEAAVRYRWINPATRNLESKITFFARAGDDICGVGAYSPQ